MTDHLDKAKRSWNMTRIGGAMPESIPPAGHISIVEKRIKSTPPLLELDGNDAKGLVRTDGE